MCDALARCAVVAAAVAADAVAVPLLFDTSSTLGFRSS
jgi:hypothetical protein